MTRPNYKSVELHIDVHNRLRKFQYQQFDDTGIHTTLRGCIGLLLDKEALYRERLKRLNDMALSESKRGNPDNLYARAADIMAGEGEEG